MLEAIEGNSFVVHTKQVAAHRAVNRPNGTRCEEGRQLRLKKQFPKNTVSLRAFRRSSGIVLDFILFKPIIRTCLRGHGCVEDMTSATDNNNATRRCDKHTSVLSLSILSLSIQCYLSSPSVHVIGSSTAPRTMAR